MKVLESAAGWKKTPVCVWTLVYVKCFMIRKFRGVSPLKLCRRGSYWVLLLDAPCLPPTIRCRVGDLLQVAPSPTAAAAQPTVVPFWTSLTSLLVALTAFF